MTAILREVKSWRIDAPEVFDIEQTNTNIAERKNFGGGLILPIGGSAQKIVGAKRSCYAYQSAPGTIPLYMIVSDTFMHVSNSYLAMKRFAEANGFKIKDIVTAKEGVAYHVSSKGLKKYVVDTIKIGYEPSYKMSTAADELLTRLVQACSFLKGKRVLTPISGGTDGMLTALALKLAGVEQICVCVGRTEEDFDPSYARGYAEQLGLDYRFLTLPESDADIEQLLARTLENIEMTDFSNVLMGMCNTLLAEYAIEHGCVAVATADLADVILGNDIFSYGTFRKENPNPTANKWAELRLRTGLKNLPNNFQIWKAYNFAGVDNIQLFNDRTVIEFLLSLTLDLTPPNGKKPIYYEILNRYVTGGSWTIEKKKVGFYTGSGIGKIRLDNPLLSDENIRRIFASL